MSDLFPKPLLNSIELVSRYMFMGSRIDKSPLEKISTEVVSTVTESSDEILDLKYIIILGSFSPVVASSLKNSVKSEPALPDNRANVLTKFESIVSTNAVKSVSIFHINSELKEVFEISLLNLILGCPKSIHPLLENSK